MIRVASYSSIAALLLGLATPANALSNRAWVSGHGNDMPSCGSPGSPCRSLQYVHDNIVASGGEIDILDAAGYGAVTISKALSIVNDGVGTAGVQQPTPNQTAITITAGSSDSVTLRGLNIDGLGAGGNGIAMSSGGSLTIVNCVVRRFAVTGVSISPSSGSTTVFISNTIVSDNNLSGYGIRIVPTGTGAVTSVFRRTTIANNGAGLDVTNVGASASATIIDSVAANNAGAGFSVAGTGAIMRIGRSVATGNTFGVTSSFSGSASSYDDNKIDGNTTNVSGLFPVISKQ
jgi:hypothetical protein